MTVSYSILGNTMTKQGSVWTILKYFYKKDAQYGEFYLCINLKDRLVKFESKEGYYEDVLTQAFQDAMRKL
jgi:hypothetical protein